MTSICAEIAGVQVSLSASDSSFFTRRLKAYSLSQKFESPDFTVSSSICDKLPNPEGKEILRARNIRMFETGGKNELFVHDKNGEIVAVKKFSPDFASAELSVLSGRCHPWYGMTEWEYLYTGEMFANRLVMMGGVVLHASALAFSGEGIAFSAPCGTGKSTHTALWKSFHGGKVQIINDDKPAIREKNGDFFIFGTPWSGKTDTNENASAPLRAIVILEQANSNKIKRLSSSESVYHLSSQIHRPLYSREIGIKTIDFIERLISAVPVFLLSCNISEEAVRTVEKTIFA